MRLFGHPTTAVVLLLQLLCVAALAASFAAAATTTASSSSASSASAAAVAHGSRRLYASLNAASLQRARGRRADAALGVADFNKAQMKAQVEYLGKAFAHKAWKGAAPLSVGGSAVLYCMDQDAFKLKLGKEIPGDFDFVVLNPTEDEDCANRMAVSNKFAELLKEVLPQCQVEVVTVEKKKCSSVRVKVDSKAPKDECPADTKWEEGFDMHATYGDDKKAVRWCECDGPCAGLHLTPLDLLKADYDVSSKSQTRKGPKKEADKKKLELVNDLIKNGNCGPCKLVKA